MSLFVVLGLLGACTPYPDFSARISDNARNAPFPSLVDINPLLAGAGVNTPEPIDFAASLTRRAASLRARAAVLRRAVVVDRRTRASMAAALRRQGR